MALSTTQYGYIIDPMVPFTDGKGNTIKDGFVRVFVAGSSTPVITYRNFDGATNQDRIELDNSGRTKTSVIGSKGLTYKVCVYDKHHSQESPILTVDKVSVIGANITAGTGATVVTGLDGLTTKPDGFVDASVIGTDGYVALDHTLVTDVLDTDAKVTAVENDRYIPLLNEDVNDPDSKITLGRMWQWVLGKIKSLPTTITAFRTGDVIPVDGPSGTAKMSKDDLLKETAENAVGVHKTDSGTITGSTYNLVSVHAPVGTTLTIKIATSSTVNLVANGSTIIAIGKNSGTYQYTTTTENTNIGFYLYGASCTYSLDVLYGEVYESIRELQNDAVDIHNEIGNTIHETGTITTSTYNIVVISTKIGDVVNVKVDTSSSVNLVMNGTTPIAYGITSGVYKFIATSTTTSVGFYIYGASCTYTLDVVAGSNIKNDVTELGYVDDNLQNQIGTKIEKTGTITSSTYNIVTIKTKVGDAVNIEITTSSAVNLVANNSTIIATSVTSGTYKFVATSTTTNIGFYLYGASCDYTIDVVAGDNLRNKIIELGYVDENLQTQIGQRVEESGTITASTYNIARISTKVGDLVNIQVNISSSVNLVVNGGIVLAYGITGSHKYQFTATSGTTSVGFYLYGASCTYEMKVTAGSNLNNNISNLEQDVDTLGITKTLKTKELLVLGDSISVTTGYFKFLKNYFAKANSVAVAGATWADHSDTDAYNGTPTSEVYKYNVMGNQVQKVKNNSSSYNPDFIILSAGTNDDTPNSDYPSEDLFTHNDSYVSLGTPTFDASDTYMLNRRTIGGAMRYCITELEKLYPNAKIIVLTPIQASNSLRAYWTIARRQNYISSTAHRMASSVVDVGKNCGIYGDFEWHGSSWTEIEPDSREGRDLSDGLHPNDSGRKKMSDYIFSQICTMVS